MEYLGWSGPVTWRIHQATLEWLDYEWGQPDLQCYYLARVAMELRRIPHAVWGKSVSLDLQDFILKFVAKGSEGSEDTLNEDEQRVADEACKARWRRLLGRKEVNGAGTGVAAD